MFQPQNDIFLGEMFKYHSLINSSKVIIQAEENNVKILN